MLLGLVSHVEVVDGEDGFVSNRAALRSGLRQNASE